VRDPRRPLPTVTLTTTARRSLSATVASHVLGYVTWDLNDALFLELLDLMR
jgi:hypothetical protein